MKTTNRPLIELTDSQVIKEIYNSQVKINSNIKIGDITRDRYGKYYVANFLGREGYASCMFIDRAWLSAHFGTAMLWFKKDGGIKYYPSNKSKRKQING